MTTIDPGHRLAAAVHAEVEALRSRSGAQAQAAGRTQASQRTSSASPSSPASSALSDAVAQRIAHIARDDPDRRRKAFRVFLETALLQGLGTRVIEDPAFPLLVDDVQSRMLEDAQLAKAAEELAGYLLQAPGT